MMSFLAPAEFELYYLNYKLGFVIFSPMFPFVDSQKVISKIEELYHLLLDTNEEVEDEDLKKRIDKYLILAGNFTFFILCLLMILFTTGFLLSLLPEMAQRIIKNLFDITNYKNWRTILFVIFYFGFAVLIIATLLLKIRKYIRIYKLAKFYTYIEIINLISRADKPIYMSLLEAIKKTLS